jgi:hypothetical protein
MSAIGDEHERESQEHSIDVLLGCVGLVPDGRPAGNEANSEAPL